MIILRLTGGLGNQMFQYAFGHACALRLGTRLMIDATNPTLSIHNGVELERAFNIELDAASRADVRKLLGTWSLPMVRSMFRRMGAARLISRNYVEEPHFHFAPEMLSVRDGSYLAGYWQSEKYFAAFADAVREVFTFRGAPQGQNKALADAIGSAGAGAVSLHIRRGDYAANPAVSAVYGKFSIDYYRDAVAHVAAQVSNPHFYVFSDDIGWTRENLGISQPHTFVDHNRAATSYEDMRLMSLCSHHVIANSTFSWWGAWLNRKPGKLVVAPINWFANGNGAQDLIPADWVRL